MKAKIEIVLGFLSSGKTNFINSMLENLKDETIVIIQNEFGETMLYSKVFREKSGGETQVPFYVAIIASFVRIYTQNNISQEECL